MSGGLNDSLLSDEIDRFLNEFPSSPPSAATVEKPADDSVIILKDANGDEIVKGRNHPDNIQLIELSSDEEQGDEENNNVTLDRILPKKKSSRPTDRQEITMEENVYLSSKRGYIKEWIEEDGLGVIFSQEVGLVLFHFDNLWIDGWQSSPQQTRDKFYPGTRVEFIELVVKHPSIKVISPNCVMRQAVGAWIGSRPKHLAKIVAKQEFLQDLRNQREDFIDQIPFFMELAMVRAKGKVVAHYDRGIGVIEVTDDHQDKNARVLFHVTDVYLFKDALRRDDNLPWTIPVGLNVHFDARKIDPTSLTFQRHGICYQACAVFAGSAWPQVPHPTVLPGGHGTFAPSYEGNDSYFYLQAELGRNLELKSKKFEQNFQDDNTLYVEFTIRNGQDYHDWRQTFAPPGLQGPRPNHGGTWKFSRRLHQHKFTVPGMINVKKERLNMSMIKKETSRFVKLEK
jgi:hypothetical protein